MAVSRRGANHHSTYEGNYVAFDPSGDNQVIAYGKLSDRVAEKARGAGVAVPVIVYFPKKNTSYLY